MANTLLKALYCNLLLFSVAIPEYNDMFSYYGRQHMPMLDWRWIRSQCWAESSLRPDAVSPVGAVGLCQFMKGTWSDVMKIPSVHRRDARWSIAAASKYDRQLWEMWSEPRPKNDRLKLILASYNAGAGNIIKAQKLSRAAGGEGLEYNEIIKYLPQVTGHHSEETIGYVNRITEHYPSPDDIKDTKKRTGLKYNTIPSMLKYNTITASATVSAENLTPPQDEPLLVTFTPQQEDAAMEAIPELSIIMQLAQGGTNASYLVVGLFCMLLAIRLGWKLIDSLTSYDTSEEIRKGNPFATALACVVLGCLIISVAYLVAKLLG